MGPVERLMLERWGFHKHFKSFAPQQEGMLGYG